ncbi:fumarylacetoacetate hydrolase family protein [Nitratifractor sp.]
MHTVTFGSRRVTPSKIVCVGRNYVAHIEELGNEMPDSMVLFNKPNSALTDTLRYFTPQTRFEGELCFLIKGGRIAGVGFGFDLTHADVQNRLKAKGLPWERAKAFDGSAVMSPFVPFDGDWSGLGFTLRRNGAIVQEATCERMIYKPDAILAEIGTFMTLEDGDVVMSGTPEGVSTYEAGDRFEVVVYRGKEELLHHSWICQEA